MLRILHTSDWHLGHTLHDLPRDAEHTAFLDWLLAQLRAHAVDALLVSGDIFETANPPARAMRAWYDFLARARAQQPGLDIVVVGGNHDSPARLEAAHPVLEAFGIHVVGSLPRTAERQPEVDRLVVPLHDASGAVAAWCAAVPFLRPADLPPGVQAGIEDGGDPLVAGVRAVYDAALGAARARRQAGQALVAMGHAYMVGGTLSELSERRVLGGNQHALPASIFPSDTAYVALGHLHRAQRVGGREGVRYAGSPIPLAVDEDRYAHQVLLVELEGEALVGVESLRVPRTVDILRVPGREGGPWEEVAAALEALPEAQDADGGASAAAFPYLEVRVTLDGPRPSLRRDVEALIKGKAVRLVKLAAVRQGDGRSLAGSVAGRELSDLRADEVFERKWARDYGGSPPDTVLACFHELLDAVGQQQGSGGAA